MKVKLLKFAVIIIGTMILSGFYNISHAAESRVSRYEVYTSAFVFLYGSDIASDQTITVNAGEIVRIYGAYASGSNPGSYPPGYPTLFGIRDQNNNEFKQNSSQAPNPSYYWWWYQFTASSEFNGKEFRPWDYYAYYPKITVSLNKQAQNISFGKLDDKTYGDSSFSLSANASSGLGVSYTSSNPSVASVSGNTVTIHSVGTTNITASQSGNSNYYAAADVTQTLNVNQKSQTITFDPLATHTFGEADFNLSATASSGLDVSYTSSDTNVAEISGNSVSIVGVGATTITAIQSGNSNYSAASPVTQVLTVDKKSQTITFHSLADMVYGDAILDLTAAASSNMPITYNSSNLSVANLSGSALVIVGPGVTTITAVQVGSATYSAASVDQTLAVGKKSLSIIGGFAVSDKSYDGTNTAAISNNNLSLSGTVTGDSVTFSPVLTFSSKDAGTHTVSISSSSILSGADASKYQLTHSGTPTASAIISAKELTVSGASVTMKVYNGTTSAAISGAVLWDVITGEDVDLLNCTIGTFSDKNVGSGKAVSTAMELTGAAIGNYTLIQPTLTGTITYAGLTVSGISVIPKVYDGTTVAAITGASLVGVITGDDISLSSATSGSYASKNVDTGISVTPLFTLSGPDAANYTINPVNLTGDITKKPLTITADSKTKTSDGTTFGAFAVSFSSFVTGDSAADLDGTLEFGGDAVTATAPGVYTITAIGFSSTNYAITYVDGTLTISAVTVGSSGNSKNLSMNSPATTMTTTVNGQQASVMTLNPQTVTQLLNQVMYQNLSLSQTRNPTSNPGSPAGTAGPEVVLQFTQPQPVNVASLSGQVLETLSGQNASLVMETPTASYSVPVAQIDLAGAAQQLGPNVPASAVKVDITIAVPTSGEAKNVADSSAKGGFQVIVPPIDFSIICSYGDKSIEVSSFETYVSRQVAIPSSVDIGQVSTAVVVRSDGSWYHVPTRIMVIDGKYYAQINSLTNSTYVMVHHPIAFRDMEKHWAKEAVNDLGSRFVVSGYGEDKFAPGKNISRAEFSAILMKGLGIAPKPLDPAKSAVQDDNQFKDVKPRDWYAGYVKIAFEYELISGYADKTFRPGDQITREQAMVMIARAMEITELTTDLKAGEADAVLLKYRDASKIQSYAKSSIAACIKAGIVTGRPDGTLNPQAGITRAEVAVILRNLLQKSDLI